MKNGSDHAPSLSNLVLLRFAPVHSKCLHLYVYRLLAFGFGPPSDMIRSPGRRITLEFASPMLLRQLPPKSWGKIFCNTMKLYETARGLWENAQNCLSPPFLASFSRDKILSGLLASHFSLAMAWSAAWLPSVWQRETCGF